jgi:hypothetical protein
MIARCLQHVRADDVLMTYNASGLGAIVPCYSAAAVRLAKAMTRQDNGYAVDHTQRGRVNKTGRVGHHLASSSHNIYF